PLDDVNKSQSTNDVFPSAVKIAVLRLLKQLEDSCAYLQKNLQEKESEYREIIFVGRTEWQDAVLLTLGQQFSAWAEPISRDRWRIYKSIERIRVINLGATAIGTGLNAHQKYSFSVINSLRDITGLSLVKSENLIDSTQNCDVFAEISGLLRANAVNLNKICSDIRFLSCGPAAGISELKLKPLQKGSTIMPAKVNPVAIENIIQSSMLVAGLDSVLCSAAAGGHLQLNPYMPLIAYCIIKELKLMIQSNINTADIIIKKISPDLDNIKKNVDNSYCIFTALTPMFGYRKVEDMVHDFEIKKKKNKKLTSLQYLKKYKIVSDKELKKIKENIIKYSALK
nr:aspartate ammonia-lyase [Candidatus Dependentiae bacterium]